MNSLIKDYLTYAELAAAAYAHLQPGLEQGAIKLALRDEDTAEFTATQADDFIKAGYEIIDQFESPTSGFSATVFKKGGQYFFAIRGSTPFSSIISDWENFRLDWFGTNFGDIGGDGIAIKQALDMYNYFKRLTATQGVVLAQYRYDQASNRILTDYTTNNSQEAGKLASLNVAANIIVTGHSTGAHLANILTRLVPDRIQAAYAYSGPGLDTLTVPVAPPGSEGFFDLLSKAVPSGGGIVTSGWTSPSLPPVVNIGLNGDTIFNFGFMPYGRTSLYSEGEGGIIGVPHKITLITDALRVYELLSIIDSSRSTADKAPELLSIGAGIFRAATNIAENSLETAVKALAKVFNQTLPVALNTDNRDELHQATNFLKGIFLDAQGNLKASYQGLTLTSLVGVSESTIASNASGLTAAYRYALRELNPFVITGNDSIYTPHNTGGVLEIANFTEKYLADRTAVLVHVLRRNIQDIPNGLLLPGGEAQFIEDRQLGISFTLTAGSTNTQIIFGKDTDDAGASALTGGAGADRLYGGFIG